MHDEAGAEMYSWQALPVVSLNPIEPLTAELNLRGITDFREAGRYLQALPYGRTTNRADFAAVLREGKGTCSTKHGLLAAVAREQNIPVVLALGIYEMRELNTPGVGSILARNGLAVIPEAHCYLKYEGKRIDITRSGAESAEPISRFLHEETIAPEQIGDYKTALHRQFMQQWLSKNSKALEILSFEDMWQIREECIAALEQ
jgi:hypothetical protein